jgi:hypothetical protein
VKEGGENHYWPQRGCSAVEPVSKQQAAALHTADQIKVKAEIFIPRSPDFGYKKYAASARRVPNADMRISPSDQSWLPRFGCVYDGVIQLFRLDDNVWNKISPWR